MSASIVARLGAPALAPRRARLSAPPRARPTLAPPRPRGVSVTAEDVAAKLSGEDLGKWESCRSILVGELGMDEDKADKTMIRAFGWGGQTYRRNEKVEEVPEVEDVEARIAYLLEIGIELPDLAEKVLGKVPEVLGCDVETRLKVERGAHPEDVLHEAQHQELQELHQQGAAGARQHPRLRRAGVELRGECNRWGAVLPLGANAAASHSPRFFRDETFTRID